MVALADVFVRVKADTTGLSAEMTRDVKAAAKRVDAKVNVQARVQLDQSILRTEIDRLKTQLRDTGDVTLRPRIQASEAELKRLESSLDDAVTKNNTSRREKFWNNIIAGGVAASPLIGAAIAGGLGLTGLGVGIAAAIQNPDTLNAVTSLGDSLKTELMGAAESFNGAIETSIPIVQSAFASVQPQLSQIFGELAPTLAQLAMGFAGFLQSAMPGIVAAAGTAASLFSTLSTMLPTLGASISGFFQMIASHGDDIKSGLVFAVNLLNAATQVLTGTLSGLMTVFGPILGVLGSSSSALKVLATTILAVWAATKAFTITVGIVQPLLAAWPAVSAAASLGMAVLTGSEEAATVAAGELAIATGVATGGISTIIGLLVAAGAGFAIFKGGLSSSGTAAGMAANQFQLMVPPLKDVNNLMKLYGINRRDAERFVATGKTTQDVEGLKLAWLDAKQAMQDHFKANHQAALDANRDLVLANRSVRDANQGVSDAEATLTQDHKDAKQAQLELTQARKDATRQLEDLREKAQAAADAEEDTAIKQIKAQDKLALYAGVDHSDLGYRQAALDAKEATEAHANSLVANKNAQDDLTVAQRKGIEGSDQVVAAKKRIDDIDKRTAADERALSKAHEAVNDALYNQVKASQAAKIARDNDTHSLNINTAAGRENLKLQEAYDAANKAFHPTAGTDPNGETDAHRAKRIHDALTPTADENTGFWSGMWQSAKDVYFDPISTFFGETLPGWLDLNTHAHPGWSGFWQDLEQGVDDKLFHPVGNFFGHTLPDWLDFKEDPARGWKGYWSDLKSGVDDKLFHPVGHWFSATLPDFFKNIGKSIGSTWTDFWDDTRSDFNSHLSTPISNFFTKTIPGLFTGLGKGIAGIWTDMKTSATTGLNDVIKIVNGAISGINKVTSLFNVPTIPNIPLVGGSVTGKGSVPQIAHGLATGGPVNGPGGPREDKVPAWLSNGEFVHNADAVSFYGEGFMHALNKKLVPKFASGGLVDHGSIAEIIATMAKSGITVDGASNRYTDPSGFMGRSHGYEGGRSYHDHDEAVDFNGPNEHSIAVWWMNNFGSKLKELIHTDSGSGPSSWSGEYIKDGKVVPASFYSAVANDHKNHVHVAALPGFSDGKGGGILSGIVNTISGVVGGLTKDLISPIVNPVLGRLRGMGLPGQLGAGALSQLEDAILGTGSTAAGAGGGNTVSGSLGAWINEAIKDTGVPASWAGGKGLMGLYTLIMRESGGNPNSINRWDSNARAGHPSQGLMQTIPSTFEHYRLKSLPDRITDPVANIAAGINYILARYGSIANVQQADPNKRPKGYDNGGWLTDVGVNHTGKPEAVLTPEESANYKRMAQSTGDLSDATIRKVATALVQALQTAPPGTITLDSTPVGSFVRSTIGSSLRL